ncbi:MAG: hypothetical protein ABI442_14255 [Gemmatimonadaceae bacterium]
MARVDSKWIDNLLSHYSLPGVHGGRQGNPRRITVVGIAHIVLIQRLSATLGVRILDAVPIAENLLGDSPVVNVEIGVVLSVDRASFLAEVGRLVDHAAEAIVPARRGRPAGSKAATLA